MSACGSKTPEFGSIVVDAAPTRCPELEARYRAEARRRTARPPAPVTVSDIRAWIDRLEVSEARKAALLAQLATEYERCRNPKPEPTS